jgi:hypothetical protein
MIRFRWVWISGWIFAERLPAIVGLEPSAPLLPFRVTPVAPEVRVCRELADVRRESADERPEVLLLNRVPLGLVQADELGQLPGVDVVVPLLDDHRRRER